MVCFVSGDPEGERSHGPFVVIRHAPAVPCIIGKMFEEEQRCYAHSFIFPKDIAERQIAEIRIGRKYVLVEAWQFGRVVTRESQGAVSKHALSINDVAD